MTQDAGDLPDRMLSGFRLTQPVNESGKRLLVPASVDDHVPPAESAVSPWLEHALRRFRRGSLHHVVDGLPSIRVEACYPIGGSAVVYFQLPEESGAYSGSAAEHLFHLSPDPMHPSETRFIRKEYAPPKEPNS